MTITAIGLPPGGPQGDRYAADMARIEYMGIENARKVLGERVDKAREDEIHTVMTRHSEPAAILVDPDWYVSAREAMGDPVEFPPVVRPAARQKSRGVGDTPA